MLNAEGAAQAFARLQFDPGLQLWVLSHANNDADLLKHPACCLCESSLLVSTLSSVPAVGGACLPRGEPHREIERMIAAVLEGVTPHEVREAVRRCSARLLREGSGWLDEDALREYARLLPAHVLGMLLGAGPEQIDVLAERAGRCGLAGEPHAPLGLAPAAAQELLHVMRAVAEGRGEPRRLPGLLGRLAGLAARRPGIDLQLALQRLAQLFYLMHKASSAMLRNTLLALIAEPIVQRCVLRERSLLALFVREMRRHAPPLHHAFRVCGRDVALAGQRLRAGDALVAVFAAPQMSLPDTMAAHFLPDRKSAKVLTFGTEPFASPSQLIAETITDEGVAGALRSKQPVVSCQSSVAMHS